MAPNYVNTTPLDGASREKLIAILHDHKKYFTIASDAKEDPKLISGTAGGAGSTATYDVMSSAAGQHNMTLTNNADGVSSDGTLSVMGGKLHLKSDWKVTTDSLVQEGYIETSWLIRKAAEGPTQRSGADQGKKFVQAAKDA